MLANKRFLTAVEYESVQLYTQFAELVDDELMKEVLEEIETK